MLHSFVKLKEGDWVLQNGKWHWSLYHTVPSHLCVLTRSEQRCAFSHIDVPVSLRTDT